MHVKCLVHNRAHVIHLCNLLCGGTEVGTKDATAIKQLVSAFEETLAWRTLPEYQVLKMTATVRLLQLAVGVCF